MAGVTEIIAVIDLKFNLYSFISFRIRMIYL